MIRKLEQLQYLKTETYEKILWFDDNGVIRNAVTRDVEDCASNFEVIFDNFPDVNFGPLLPTLAFDGCYLTCGVAKQGDLFQEVIEETSMKLRDFISLIVRMNISFVGSCLGTRADLESALRLCAAGKLRLPEPISYQPSNAIDFLKHSFAEKEKLGKIVLQM